MSTDPAPDGTPPDTTPLDTTASPSTLLIVGAGPGTGMAVARRFGREGFAVALISRDQDNLDRLAAELEESGVMARGFAADVTDRDALRRAVEEAANWRGPIEVLQYSPIPPATSLKALLGTSAGDVDVALDFSVRGPVTAVDAVLPGMRELGRGTIVFVNGGTAVRPRGGAAGTSIAFAAESSYARLLHEALTTENVHVAQLVVPGAISEDDPESSPAAIAEQIWSIHRNRDTFRTFQTPMPAE